MTADVERRRDGNEEPAVVDGGDPGAGARPQKRLQGGVERGGVDSPTFFHPTVVGSARGDLESLCTHHDGR